MDPSCLSNTVAALALLCGLGTSPLTPGAATVPQPDLRGIETRIDGRIVPANRIATAGCAVTVSQDVVNAGDVRSTGTVVRIAAAGGTARLVAVPPLDPGEAVRVSGTLPLPEGRSVVRVDIDPWDGIGERVEADNITRIAIDAAGCRAGRRPAGR